MDLKKCKVKYDKQASTRLGIYYRYILTSTYRLKGTPITLISRGATCQAQYMNGKFLEFRILITI